MNLKHRPAQLSQLRSSDAAPLALVAVDLKALLPALPPLARQVVAARCVQAW
jgi:hypothetical protein